jgi:N-acetyl-gamma-glutamylphosphate reductase
VVITLTGNTGTIGSELMRLLSARRSLTGAVFRDTRRLRGDRGRVSCTSYLKDEGRST